MVYCLRFLIRLIVVLLINWALLFIDFRFTPVVFHLLFLVTILIISKHQIKKLLIQVNKIIENSLRNKFVASCRCFVIVVYCLIICVITFLLVLRMYCVVVGSGSISSVMSAPGTYSAKTT